MYSAILRKTWQYYYEQGVGKFLFSTEIQWLECLNTEKFQLWKSFRKSSAYP